MRQNGTVKFFNASKGYGFITPDEGGNDVFVHVTAVERSGLGALTDGQRVSFEAARGLEKEISRRLPGGFFVGSETLYPLAAIACCFGWTALA